MQLLAASRVGGARVAARPCRAAGAPRLAAQRRLRPVLLAAAAEGKTVVAKPPPPITLTDAALQHLKKLRAEHGGEELLLRMGVRSGGCSGMSYVMDFEKPENVAKDDTVMEYAEGFRLVCDPKSLLYLFGMQLDWSSALVGGGFQFHNPNSTESCGCGKSFNV